MGAPRTTRDARSAPRADGHDHPAGTSFTRRRALALGAAGGMSALLVREAPALGAGGGVRTTGMALPASAAPGGGRAGAVLRPPGRFDLVGLRDVDLRGARAEIRVRRRGAAWSPWVPLGAGADHAPDAHRAAPASDPVWAGGADELQLRAARRLRGGRLALISAPAQAVPRRTTARAAATTRQAGAPVIIPRDGWGAGAVPPRGTPSFGAVQLAFVHHTVSANTYGPADSARIVLAIAKYHRDSNGWNDIGYNFLVDRYGQVFEGRAGGIDQAVIGAQAGGWNSQSTGIATIGDFGKVAYPEAGMAVLARLIAWKLSLHGVPAAGTVSLRSGGGSENRFPYGTTVELPRISGHRDGCKTACPGAVLYGQLEELRSRVVALGPIGGAVARATLTAATTRVPYGQDVVLSGRVTRADGSAAAEVPVSIQKRTSTGSWVRVASARTTAEGTYETRMAWKRAGRLRALALLAPGTDRIRSPQLAVELDTVVTVSSPAENSRVLAGASVALRGTVRPSGPVRVIVERQTSRGRWVAAGEVRATVRKTAFRARVPLKKPALYRLTAVAGSGSTRVKASPVFVRAVRRAASLAGSEGGVSGPPTGAAGGVTPAV